MDKQFKKIGEPSWFTIRVARTFRFAKQDRKVFAGNMSVSRVFIKAARGRALLGIYWVCICLCLAHESPASPPKAKQPQAETSNAFSILDSLKHYYIDLYQPELESFIAEANCSVYPDEDIIIYYSGEEGLEVNSLNPEAEILVKSLLLTTGMGLREIWENFGFSARDGEEEIYIYSTEKQGNITRLTLKPIIPFLFTEVTLKIDTKNWLIKGAKINTPDQKILTQLTYLASRQTGKHRFPQEIDVLADSTKATITHTYQKHEVTSSEDVWLPSKSVIIQEGPTIHKKLQHITVTYTPVKINSKNVLNTDEPR